MKRTFTTLFVAASLIAQEPAAPQQPASLREAAAFAEREPQTQVENAIERLLPSIVKVQGASGFSTIVPYAAGVVVSDRGHILTLDQVLVQKGSTRVVLYDGTVLDAQLLLEEPKLGVRLLRVDPEACKGKLRPVWPDEQGPAFRTGQFVVSIGNCFRLAEFSEKSSATFGVVVGKASTALRFRLADVAYDGELILTDACNNPGHYGGGLFSLDGRWLGLNTRLLESKETNTMLSAAIPSRDLLPYLKEHILGEAREEVVVERKPVRTGIVLFRQAGRTSPPAYVDRVERESPASSLGLRPDDLIVRVGEFSVRTCKEFDAALEKFSPGQKVSLMWKRGASVMQGEIELGEQKQ
jgi:S1-C subfamily serine protease